MRFIHWLSSAGNFMPHEYCYRQNPAMIGLHFWADLLIGISYVAISLTLIYMVRRARRDIPFDWIFLAFGTFIIACGGTHFMEVWTLWTPAYWLSGGVKSVTALASMLTAIVLPPLVPKTLALVQSAKLSDKRKKDLEASNAALESEIAERRRAEAEVRDLANTLEARVRERTAELARMATELAEKAAIVEHSHDAIFSHTVEGSITSWNPAAERVYGYTASEMIGRSISILMPKDRKSEPSELMDKIKTGQTVEPFETQRVRRDRSIIDVFVSCSPLMDENGVLRGASIIARDISERKRNEEQLRHAQKLESLGLIAGGVAHDFNNLLVGILGNASLILEDLPRGHDHYAALEAVVSASEKAAHLTQQLLAYAGKGRFVSERINLPLLVREITGLLHTSIRKSVQIRLELDDAPDVEGDPGQIQQVIMNLVINGAEAIGENPGTVRISTSLVEIETKDGRGDVAGESVAPGNYVALTVRDTGSGMDEAVRARIFDPFFTTKFTGRGLGLSAVLGIVRSHKGAIRVHSEPGKGSTFTILLPAVVGAAAPASPRSVSEDLQGHGVVLIVDDEELVRGTASAALKRYGYTVLTAQDGAEGVDLFRRRAAEIDVVLLDMTMPVMPGEEALGRIQALRPDARVIVTSGYDEVEAVRRFTADGIAAFIQKPYTAVALARIVKSALAKS
jgi:two-component system cell cycle sensor histidine kinase/response regulator CckA